METRPGGETLYSPRTISTLKWVRALIPLCDRLVRRIKSPGRRKIYLISLRSFPHSPITIYAKLSVLLFIFHFNHSMRFYCDEAVLRIDANHINFHLLLPEKFSHRSSFPIIILINNLNWKLSRNLVINYAVGVWEREWKKWAFNRKIIKSARKQIEKITILGMALIHRFQKEVIFAIWYDL